MFQRKIVAEIHSALADTPVVLLSGVRQSGKTTLIRGNDRLGSNYVTLDDLNVLSAAQSDSIGFISGLTELGKPITIDEIHRAPELLPVIKAAVDRDRSPGRFLLTGSANILMLPRVSDSLAGRMQIITLWPLSQAEINNSVINFVDGLFAPDSLNTLFAGTLSESRSEIVDRVVVGGYPEVVDRFPARRDRWFESYIAAILQRDVRELANIGGINQLPKLLSLLAARTSSLLNASDISRTANIPYTTLTRYLNILETTYLTVTLPAWSGNFTTRHLKSPKVLMSDTGLGAYLLGVSKARLLAEPQILGSLLENFVGMEVLKSIGWSATRPSLYHWHTANRDEVDLLLESRDGGIVGIEVKSSSTVSAGDFKGLRSLQNATGANFRRGVVVYTGDRIVPFGDNLAALPITALWQLP